jgi:hypothetical protein
MNTQTLTQRREIHAYNEARRDAIYHSERQPEPVQMCAQPEDSDPPLGMMLVWTALAIPAWVLFGWAVVALIRAFGGAA